MPNKALHYVFFGLLALIVAAGAFVPVAANAQYSYGPDYSSGLFGGTGYTYTPSYYYPDYSSQYYYPQYYSGSSYYYPQEPHYYSYAPDPYYYGPQYFYPTYPQPQQYYTPQYPYYPTYPQYPHYDYDYDDDYEPLRVTCKVSTYDAEVDEYVTWTARATGGTGSYRYSWVGERIDDDEDERQVRVRYREEGLKSPSVTVKSGSQRITRACPVINVED